MSEMIYRHEAIRTITSYNGTVDKSVAKRLLLQLPSAVPERKKGRWTYRNGKPATIGKSYSVICSECKEWSEYCTNFCPNCGCDMRG